ncbi:hypothetical protein COCSUDRAFT_59497 [Coccomyxa subellipsoidea C-169]|uniref:Uncharacterized protein n=1 Tax=Coccomyxa subellipsoidea (strain C-169) TaxID=574566 RepID=I0YKU1_COCSC|nr:hypothetical protein COCSUDRAFT_59497 [Coccomyxa subellipsoidea C-169]EIE19010.1 hypothetical protein COCSUDRAFT_59497 [Coccomyxa subellipsoidea C-169]|eukprot:XP_005643554.1 hypothetical protein COCSUDRAFT_59497 [Coccomyxa subellipsoidea C-169]
MRLWARGVASAPPRQRKPLGQLPPSTKGWGRPGRVLHALQPVPAVAASFFFSFLRVRAGAGPAVEAKQQRAEGTPLLTPMVHGVIEVNISIDSRAVTGVHGLEAV